MRRTDITALALLSVDSPTFPELADEVAKKHHREILMDKVRHLIAVTQHVLELTARSGLSSHTRPRTARTRHSPFFESTSPITSSRSVSNPVYCPRVMILIISLCLTESLQMGPDFFRQSKGIPQGSIVSTHLCSFFYADLERRHLGFTAADDCVSCVSSLPE